ncbi:MAG: MFS transporter [Pseudonocardiaceae bacterium]
MRSGHRGRAHRARACVTVVFALGGLVFASWISRTPALRAALALSEYQLGLLLLCLSSGAVAALPLAGPLVQRWGPRLVLLGGVLSVAAGLSTLAAGVAVGWAGPAGAGLVAAGLGIGLWDVAMNVEAAAVERLLDTTLMPQLHAVFSIGSVAGALLGAAASATGVSLPEQLAGTVILTVVVVLPAVRGFLSPPEAGTASRPAPSALRAWQEPRTVLLGMLVLAFAFAEGSANDWLAVALVDGHGVSDPVGALGFGAFVAAMTLARLGGGSALRRWRPAALLRAGAVLAMAGVMLVVLTPSAPVAVLGAALWGAGAALGFPLGMSAAGGNPDLAAARMGVVSAIGYTAFLAGPPLIGFLAESIGVLQALLVVLVALVLGLITAGAADSPVAAPVAVPADTLTSLPRHF